MIPRMQENTNYFFAALSGLKINILKKGGGKTPNMGQTVMMHYELWSNEGVTSSLYDYDKKEYVDDIFYSTYDEKNPFSGPIPITIGTSTPKDDIYSTGESVEGLDQALLSMQVGDRWDLVIPAELAYGEEGASSFHTFHGYRAPPNQAIRCNIELVDIKE